MSNPKIKQKSAAEFFSEHQQIAGFDNPGKSLFTSIRELVENSLDAAESINVLPSIEVNVVEYTEEEHNALHGIGGNQSKNEPEKKDGKPVAGRMYYKITCKDNGCGMAPETIGDLLGRVLSGSKHGIKQTRGKFGLGAKMVLIWSKKSSGLPIEITTSQYRGKNGCPYCDSTVSDRITHTVLDIDIYKNEPKILSSRSYPNMCNSCPDSNGNSEHWHGCELSLTIAGVWTHYRSRVISYFQQLAVITPYADFVFDFKGSGKQSRRDFTLRFQRRSDQMPGAVCEMLPHPKSLNHITLSKLLQDTKCNSLSKFLCKELSGISPGVAAKIVDMLSSKVRIDPDELNEDRNRLPSNAITALSQILRDFNQIRPPVHFGANGSYLSPVGEYNLRLGVLKELKPRLIATYADYTRSNTGNNYEGHPFLVEAAVAIGSYQNTTESAENVADTEENDDNSMGGIQIYRFANRIPLLFETGADVVTQVSLKSINWSNYLIDPKKDKVGVFVSIVSTKIPYKGTSKEYIGADVIEIQKAVKHAIQGCCAQLRVQLSKSLHLRQQKERKKLLTKYIPNVANALFGVLTSIEDDDVPVSSGKRVIGVSGDVNAKRRKILESVDNNSINVASISQCLINGASKFDEEQTVLAAAEVTEKSLVEELKGLQDLNIFKNFRATAKWEKVIPLNEESEKRNAIVRYCW